MKNVLLILSQLFIFLFIYSCSKSPVNEGGGGFTPDCSGAAKSFATDVSTITQSFCNKSGCHTNGSTNGPGPLTNYNQLFNARAAIRSAISSGLMPQDATLSSAQKSAIICWIDAGASNN